jgi:hypothetical protein
MLELLETLELQHAPNERGREGQASRIGAKPREGCGAE